MKKVLSLLMTIVLVLGCFSPTLAEKYPEGTLYKGMKGHTAEIKQLQQWLIDLEYLDDQADGKFGQNTQAAVKAFQKDRGQTADGIAWPETLELVEIYTNEPLVEYPEGTLHKGIYGHAEEIEFLQYQLFYAGYLGDDISVADGVFGSKTEAAVRQFQKEHSIDVTGIVCPDTQMALDVAWESDMELQGGEDEYAEPFPYCYIEYYANGTQAVILCSRHMQVYSEAANAVNQTVQNDDQIIEGLQAGITFWMDELKSLYQKWTDLRPEYAQQITDHQEAFMDYYRAQLGIWNAHFGSPSMAALEKAQEMLAKHCSDLCIMLSGAI